MNTHKSFAPISVGIVLAGIYSLAYWAWVVFVYTTQGSPSDPGGAGIGLALIWLNFIAFPVSFLLEPMLSVLSDSLVEVISHSSSLSLILLFVLGLMQWFFVGIVFGWIFKKIRKQDNNSLLNK